LDLDIGVRGWGEGRAEGPRFKKFQGKLCFQGQRKVAQKSCMKKYFNTVKIFRATLFFRTSASYSKVLNDKKYIFYTRSGQTCSMRLERQIVKPKLQRAATWKYKNTNLFAIYASVTSLIRFETTCKGNAVRHASW